MAGPQGEVTLPEDPAPPQIQKAANELQQICKDKWDAVETNNDEINTNIEPKTVDDSLALAKILCEKGKRVQSEIEVVKSCAPNVLPDNPEILRDVLDKDLNKSTSQLQEVLTLVHSQEKELREQITQEEEIARQLQSVSNCLEIKLEGIENDNGQAVTMNLVMQELDEKIRKAETLNKSLTKKLVHFVNNHFPLPTVEDIKAGKKKLRSSDRKVSLDNLLPFKVVLQELMNKCIDEPHDPYVILTERFWPPYIELLLRCQIVLRHPEDDQRIKLVPFHL